MSENRIENHGVTMIEGGAWAVAGLGALVWCVAGLVLLGQSDSYDPDTLTPMAWMGVGQWVAAVAVVPAILLSGIRALLPDNRIG